MTTTTHTLHVKEFPIRVGTCSDDAATEYIEADVTFSYTPAGAGNPHIEVLRAVLHKTFSISDEFVTQRERAEDWLWEDDKAYDSCRSLAERERPE